MKPREKKLFNGHDLLANYLHYNVGCNKGNCFYLIENFKFRGIVNSIKALKGQQVESIKTLYYQYDVPRRRTRDPDFNSFDILSTAHRYKIYDST